MDPATAGMSGLSAAETRVLGCLLEKQRTTPEQYPLSLNALRLACNQSTNRDPVVAYDEATIRDALHRLERRRLVRFASGSRAAKYRHLLEEVLPLEEGERAVMTVLLLRGAQTPGELKQRTERMHAFAELAGVQDTLERLIGRELVRRLDRRPGQKEERYEQLLQGGEEGEVVGTVSAATEAEQTSTNGVGGAATSASPAQGPASGTAENPKPESAELQELRERVERLEREVAELRFAMRNPSPNPLPGPAHDPSRFDPRL
ncbi:MAG TPA: YceH family protein [Solirubrobacteraceae bacterium]|nr:YceH family protein [Solirubrobacteraceae bacterium]